MAANELLIHTSAAWYAWLDHIAPSEVVVLTDEHTAKECLPYFEDYYMDGVGFHHLSVDPGESSKSLETAESIYSVMLEHGIDRSALLINLGGGVVTDLGGFVGSTFKRGLQMVHVPTTHLGMVDAALGGKNGLNLDGIKNQVGTYYPSMAVVIDPAFLHTLDERELKSGWMETVKHALIADASLWEKIVSLDPVVSAKDANIIQRSGRIKTEIAQQDVLDLGIRQSLNFGHTVGHALEAESKLLHGEAIAFGTIVEVYLSTQCCGLSAAEAASITSYIKTHYASVLPKKVSSDHLIARMRHDKKNSRGELRFALIANIGKAEVGINVDSEMIRASISFALEQLKT